MRFIYLLTMLFFAVGCSVRSTEYILPATNLQKIGSFNQQIGVKEIEVPEYLNSGKILIQKGVKLSRVDADFASTPSKLLTQKAMTTLKKSLGTPDVFLYPWDFKHKRGLFISINLDSFNYKDGYAVVDGTYFVKRNNGRIIAKRNFSYSQKVKENIQDIVVTLSLLFDKLIVDIAKIIAR